MNSLLCLSLPSCRAGDGVLPVLRSGHPRLTAALAARTAPRHPRIRCSTRLIRAEGGTAVWPGYAAPARTYTAARVSRQSPIPVLATWLAGMTVLVRHLHRPAGTDRQAAAALQLPTGLRNPDVGPAGVDQPAVHRAGRSFSVAYPGPGCAYVVTTDDSGVTARFIGGDGGEMRLTSETGSRAIRQGSRQGISGREVPHRAQVLRDAQRHGGIPARLRRGRRRLPAGPRHQLHTDAGRS